jgi:hypothetical protein
LKRQRFGTPEQYRAEQCSPVSYSPHSPR